MVHLDQRPSGNDVVILTLGADLSDWRNLVRRNGAIAVDLVDGYLGEPFWSYKRLFRGTYKTLTRQHRKPTLSYTSLLRRVLGASNGVICASPEQKRKILELNENVVVTADCMQELFNAPSANKLKRDGVRLLWEGFPENLKHFDSIRAELSCISQSRKLTIEVVTDLSGVRRGSQRHLDRFVGLMNDIGIEFDLCSWSVPQLMKSSERCDLGVIPIDAKDRMAWMKSENKLLSFWAMGLPTLTSPTPSYRRLVREGGLDDAYTTVNQWGDLIEQYSRDNVKRIEASQLVRHLSRERCTEAVVDKNWSGFLETMGWDGSV